MQNLKLGGLEFLYDGGLHDIDRDTLERPQSDSAHVVEYLRGRGYLYEGATLYMRYVWLDPVKRNELMIIYSEDLAPTGYRISDLLPGGRAAGAREDLTTSLHQRAMSAFTVEGGG